MYLLMNFLMFVSLTCSVMFLSLSCDVLMSFNVEHLNKNTHEEKIIASFVTAVTSVLYFLVSMMFLYISTLIFPPIFRAEKVPIRIYVE